MKMIQQIDDRLIGEGEDASDFGALTIREVKLKKLPEAERLQVNDQRASIVSIFLALFFAEC